MITTTFIKELLKKTQDDFLKTTGVSVEIRVDERADVLFYLFFYAKIGMQASSGMNRDKVVIITRQYFVGCSDLSEEGAALLVNDFDGLMFYEYGKLPKDMKGGN